MSAGKYHQSAVIAHSNSWRRCGCRRRKRQRRRKLRSPLAVFLPVLAMQAAVAQQPTAPPQLDIDSIVKANSHQLRTAAGEINDEGWAFMLGEIGDAQIVAIAEEHN